MTSFSESSCTLERGNKSFYDVPCTPCKEVGKHVIANKYCKECLVYICESCTKTHEGISPNKRHTFLDGTQFTEQKQSLLLTLPTKHCANHTAELINIVCEQHGVVRCSVCKVLEHSVYSKPHHIPDAVKGIQVSEQHQIITKEIESFILDVGKLLRDRTADLSRVKKEKQTAERIIVDFSKKIKESFDVLEKKGLDQLSQNVNVKINEIEFHIDYLESTREKAGDILRQLKQSEGDNESELSYHVKNVGKRLVSDSKEKILEINETLQRECIRYKINPDIENYVTSLVSLGSISNTKMATPTMEGSDICLSACQDAAISPIITKPPADHSSNIFESNVVSPECAFATTDLHNMTTLDLKHKVSPLTQNAESHPFIEVLNANCTNCSSVAISEDKMTSQNISFTSSSNSDIYVNLSDLHDILPDTTQSSQMDRCATVTYTDNCSITSSSSVCSDIYANTGHSSASSDIYDNLPCHNVALYNTDSTQRPSEVSLNTKQIARAYTPYSPAATTNTLTIYSDKATSSEKLKPCVVTESSSTASVCKEESGHISSVPERDIMDKSFKHILSAGTKIPSTQTSLSRKVSKQPVSKDEDTFTRYRPVPVMRFTVAEKSDHYDCNTFDICQSLDGKILVIDNNNHKLKRFNQSYKLQDSLRLSGDPYSVCTAGPGMAAVALRNDRKIQFINVGKKLTLAKSFPVGTNCRGMVYIDGYLHVCTGDLSCPFSGRIEVYNNNGQLQFYIPQAPKRLPSVLKYIAATEVGHHRFVTMYSSDSITMLNTTGNLHDTFSHRDLKQPEGICTDGRDQVFVCGFHSNNVVQLSSKHQQVKVILDETDGIKKPIAVHYDGLQSRLLVSCSHSNEVFVFTLK
ncbi:uncharacterized protein LOC123533528 [Mercenaria mercenaria]|uniref:uncharacterized protein LOC123533528 n=1 Tax=Mercenaria mercenaria TaxID=6596 RepID=UPI00234E89A1|nr:uncharacterized protein LOC123533528 [Mercenaria mercenaria]